MTKALEQPSLAAILASSAERTGDIILVVNAEGVVSYANGAAKAALGEGNELVGREALDVVDSLSREVFQHAIDRCFQGHPIRVEVTVGPPRRAVEMTLSTTADLSAPFLVVRGRERQLPAQVDAHLAELNRRYDEKVRELAALTGKLRELATTDALTNLFNRRAFMDRAEAEWARGKRHGAPLSCVVVDIDHFKRVNDQYLHATGDEVIKVVGSLLRTTVRTTDIPARLGGEEFVALLPQTGQHGAVLLAERFRSRIADHAFRGPGNAEVRVTCSAGVASTELDYGTFAELLGAADAALYLAKAGGRDCVRVALPHVNSSTG